MPDPKPIPTLDEIYANREPNALEKSLAEQKRLGYIPGWESWTLDNLPPNDPRAIAAKRLAINGQLTEEAIRDLFKQ